MPTGLLPDLAFFDVGDPYPDLDALVAALQAARFFKINVSGGDLVMGIVIVPRGEAERIPISPGPPVTTTFDLASEIDVLCGTIKKNVPRDWKRVSTLERLPRKKPRGGSQKASRSSARAKRKPRVPVR